MLAWLNTQYVSPFASKCPEDTRKKEKTGQRICINTYDWSKPNMQHFDYSCIAFGGPKFLLAVIFNT